MGEYLGKNWLLDNKEAQELYFECAIPLREKEGIVDVHTHHNLRQIIENKPFPNIWRAEVLEDKEEYKNNDHYIIQLAAKLDGFSQSFARDSDVSDFEKWMALARVFPHMEGNHVHQWMHLDLKRMFDIEDLVSEKTGEQIWQRTKEQLQKESFLPQNILRRANARLICTTDDPCDDLHYHEQSREIPWIKFLPTFRPDAYGNIFDSKWRNNVEKICQLTGQDVALNGLAEGLRERHAYFAKMGARASDHGLLEPYGLEVEQKRAEQIFQEAYEQKKSFSIYAHETKEFISYLMHQFCAMNQEQGMVTQIHYGAVRNANQYLFSQWGPDVGGDVAADHINVVENLRPLLSKFFSGKDENEGHLVLYSMNQTFFPTNLMLERAFPRVHTGFPWWQNDNIYIMEDCLLHLISASLWSSSAGPVCDGRKILSEGSRFEVFDRVICRALGKLWSTGAISKEGAFRATKGLMIENQRKIFQL
ncbi:MAG: glucuronate isomerase [Candidatus Atribacteria bacterium]|nr:glucuronate isomerase [Candidatus Atribacteria bacterium]